MTVNHNKDGPDDSQSPNLLVLKATTYDFQDLLEIVNWFTSVNFRAIQGDTFAKHSPGTGTWFITSPKFQEWLSRDSRVLWGKGLRRYLFGL